MIDIPLIDELRETRRRLAEQQGNDVQRYAAMLGEVARGLPGTYVAKPLLPPVRPDLTSQPASSSLVDPVATAAPSVG
jgi:hypothetical protein